LENGLTYSILAEKKILSNLSHPSNDPFDPEAVGMVIVKYQPAEKQFGILKGQFLKRAEPFKENGD